MMRSICTHAIMLTAGVVGGIVGFLYVGAHELDQARKAALGRR